MTSGLFQLPVLQCRILAPLFGLVTTDTRLYRIQQRETASAQGEALRQ